MVRFIFVLVAMLLLSACQLDIDADLARTCRIAISALEPDDSTISISSQHGNFTLDKSSYLVEIKYINKSQSPNETHQISCQFGAASSLAPAARLEQLRLDHRDLTDIQLLMLKRFWLGYGSSSLADPEAIQGLNAAPILGLRSAYILQHAVNALPLAMIYGLLAISYSLIYGLLGRINLAFGELASIGGYAAVVISLAVSNYDPALIFACAIAGALYAAGIHGAVLSRLVFLPLSRSSGQQALVGTIGLAVFLQEYLRLSQGNDQRWSPPLFHNPVAIAKSGEFVVTISPIMVLITLSGALAASVILLMMQKSQFGKNWRAFSDDPLAAELFGINPNLLFLQSFALASASAGLAGACLTLYFGGLGFGASTTLGLKALIAAILGGIGSIWGAMLGGLIVALIETLWSAYFLIDYREIVIYSLLAILLILRPGGLTNMVDIPRRKL